MEGSVDLLGLNIQWISVRVMTPSVSRLAFVAFSEIYSVINSVLINICTCHAEGIIFNSICLCV